jgi:FMN phosphatase YigB (HAD superfamily)
MSEPKVIAFDVMNTVADTSGVPREELREYVECFSRWPYRPQEIPYSWREIPLHADAVEGITRLQTMFTVATCSNVPVSTLRPMLENGGLKDVLFVEIEKAKVYKPDPEAYESFCRMAGVRPEEVLMVTANPKLGKHDYGDVEAAQRIGMQAQLIRNPGCPQTIIELAEALGA